MNTGEQPAVAEKPLSHSTPITLALALAALSSGIYGSFAAGQASNRLDTVEARAARHETISEAAAKEQAATDKAQDLLLSRQSSDIAVVKETVQAINRRQERWEERGFVRVRGER